MTLTSHPSTIQSAQAGALPGLLRLLTPADPSPHCLAAGRLRCLAVQWAPLAAQRSSRCPAGCPSLRLCRALLLCLPRLLCRLLARHPTLRYQTRRLHSAAAQPQPPRPPSQYCLSGGCWGLGPRPVATAALQPAVAAAAQVLAAAAAVAAAVVVMADQVRHLPAAAREQAWQLLQPSLLLVPQLHARQPAAQSQGA